jgi:hypothetical protein
MFCRLAISHRTLRWIVGGSVLVALTGVLIAATRSYYIQEMLAALVLFTVLFSVVAGALLLLILLDRGGAAVLGFLESRGKAVLQQAWGGKPLSEHWFKI